MAGATGNVVQVNVDFNEPVSDVQVCVGGVDAEAVYEADRCGFWIHSLLPVAIGSHSRYIPLSLS